MAVTYKKLWHLFIDRNLMKKDHEDGAICQALNVRVEDIMDFVPDEK